MTQTLLQLIQYGRDILRRRVYSPLLRRSGFQIAGGLVVILVLGYISYQFLYLVSKPDLILLNPGRLKILVREPFIDVGGTLREEARLSINNRPVSIISGAFHQRLYLALGLNKINIEAVNLRGKLAERELYVVYNP